MKKFLITLISLAGLAGCQSPRPETEPVRSDSQADQAVRERKLEQARLSDLDAEIVFSQAQDLKYLGKYDEAIYKMEYLLRQGIQDKYLYLNLLKDYLEWISLLQQQGETDRRLAVLVSQARKVGDQAYSLYPDFLEILYQYGEVLRLDNANRAMLQLLQHILDLDINDVYANYYLGNYYFQSGDALKSKLHFYRILTYANTSSMLGLNALFTAHYYLGKIAASEGYVRTAITYLETARSYYNQGSELDELLGLYQSWVIQPEKAAGYFSQIPWGYLDAATAEVYGGVLLYLDSPGFAELAREYADSSVFLQACLLYQMGEYAQALQQLRNYTLPQGRSPFYLYSLYQKIYQELGEHQKSLQYQFLMSNLARIHENYALALKLVQVLEKEDWLRKEVYWVTAQMLEQDEDYQRALDYYQKFLSEPVKSQEKLAAELQMARMWLLQEKQEQAWTALIQLEEQQPDPRMKMEVASFSGILRMEKQDYHRALGDLQRAYHYDNNDARIYYLLGTLHARQKSYEQAIITLENALQFYPQDGNVNNLLAYMYAESGTKLEKALELVDRALLQDPNNLAFLDTRGWVLFRQARVQESLNLFQKLYGQLVYYGDMEGIDEIYLHLGQVYESLGRLTEARDVYRAGNKVNPANPDISQRLENLEKH